MAAPPLLSFSLPWSIISRGFIFGGETRVRLPQVCKCVKEHSILGVNEGVDVLTTVAYSH